MKQLAGIVLLAVFICFAWYFVDEVENEND